MPEANPLRLPADPPPFQAAFAVRDSAIIPSLPQLRRLPFRRAVPTTPVDRIGARWLSRWRAPAPGSSRSVLPSPLSRRVGVHIAAFEACSGFTRVTARRIARPPFRGLCHGASTCPVTRSCRPSAIESNHPLFEWVLPPLVIQPFGAHAKAPALLIPRIFASRDDNLGRL